MAAGVTDIRFGYNKACFSGAAPRIPDGAWVPYSVERVSGVSLITSNDDNITVAKKRTEPRLNACPSRRQQNTETRSHCFEIAVMKSDYL